MVSSSEWNTTATVLFFFFQGHYLANASNMPEVQPDYIELAKSRQYVPDDRRVRQKYPRNHPMVFAARFKFPFDLVSPCHALSYVRRDL